MTTKHPDWQEEADRLNHVVREIDQRIRTLTKFSGQMKSQVVDIRRDFWEDVTVNFDDPHEIAETYTSIRQQAELLSEKERGHEQAEAQLQTLARLRRTPYFGRIDFVEAGETEVDKVYLGIASFRDNGGSQHLVYDWRAPISSLYYDYQPGPVEYNTPAGRIAGEMTCKRQYVIRDGELVTLFDASITIGDDMLREVLGQQSDGQMKSIVATIQSEQNRIIRNERSRLIVVQGAAGSGKTSTALQRVAYLLYRHRQNLTAEDVIMFSPNPIFKSFVSTVLPELGEENIRQTTFQEYLEHRLGGMFELDDPFAQFEYIHAALRDARYDARLAAIRFKSGEAYLRLLEAYILQLGQSDLPFKPVRFRGQVIISAKAIAERFYTLEPDWTIPNRIRALTDWLLEQIAEFAVQERSQAWVDEEIELLEPEDYNRAYQALRKRKHFTQSSFTDHQKEREALAHLVLQRHLRPVTARIKRLKYVDVKRVYYNLFAKRWSFLEWALAGDAKIQWSEICELTMEAMRLNRLLYEDVTPFLYVLERLLGFQTNLSIRHVFIDEAQDYSTFQFLFVKTLFPRSRVTALGDLNQAIYAHGSMGTWVEELTRLYGERDTEQAILKKSYRSTREIVEFTKGIVENGWAIEAFERTGPKPTMTVVQSTQSLHDTVVLNVLSWQREGFRHIAIICKTSVQSEQVYHALSPKLSLNLVGKYANSYEEGIVVIPVSLAKGVEFDAVVVYDASSQQYGDELNRTLLYTACTRAMHCLAVVAEGQLSPYLPQCRG